MAYRPLKLGRLALKAQSAWGTAESSFSATDYFEAEVSVPPMARESLRTDPFRSGFEEAQVQAGTRAAIEMALRFPLHGWSTATPSGNPTEHPDALLMRVALGLAVQTGYGSANVATGGTTSSLKFTTGNANWEGSAIIVPTSGTPAFDVAFLADVDLTPTPDASTVLANLSRTPSSSGTHYGSNTIYLANDTPLPITADWIGPDADHHVRYCDGLVRSLRVVATTKREPMVEATIRFTGTPTFPGAGGSLAAYAYGYPKIPPVLGASGSRVYFNGAEVSHAETTFAVDCTLQDIEDGASNEGVAQQLVTDRKVTASLLRALTGTFTAEIGNLAPGTSISKFQVIYGATPGRAAGFCFTAPTLIEQSGPRDRNGYLAIQHTMAPQVYAGDGGVGAGAGNKSARFFFA